MARNHKWRILIGNYSNFCCYSVIQTCPDLCDPMDCSLPCALPSPEDWSNSCPSNQWCHPTISSSVIPFPSCLQSFPASGSFPLSLLFASADQNIGALTSASVLPMNNQDWFPLGLTGLISFLSKWLNSLVLSLFYCPTLISIHDY